MLHRKIIRKMNFPFVTIPNLKKCHAILIFCFGISICCNNLKAQRTDSTLLIYPKSDTSYFVRKNIPRSKFIGNLWHISTSYNLCKTNEFDFNIGRSYGVSINMPHGSGIHISSWGTGFGITSKKGTSTQLAKIFVEYCYNYIGTLGCIRVDYIYDIKNYYSYIRPAAGFSFILFDILYSYSFNLNGNDNVFKHGVTFRIKYFHNEKNMQRNYTSKKVQ
ncbi:MAG: hypothetical protein V2A54_04540 [Bacteroidota bacterium]